MGVPAFFRWLSRKYPSVIIECVENKEINQQTGENVYEDATLPNPNGIEFDNLYLDMNGIIHPCTHPEDKPAPKDEEEMMCAIFDCIDRLFGIVRPRKLLYMAIDGVAPRAKMNQQRSRRFRAAKEAVEKQAEIDRIRKELLDKGCILPSEKPKEAHFDSNCITPGTPFMARLSQSLHYYIHERMNNNPAWKSIKVILSDANVPGEGEHKIMDFIRKQRAQPDHDPNTKHVLCGADADLIMLGLATHEPHFTIIREEFLPNKPRPCDVCGQFGHEMDKCQGLLNANTTNACSSNFKPDTPIGAEVKFIFVRLNVLKEYLKKTMEMPNLPFKYDFDRVVDDWVFMCFFVGNDFLPHLPSLEIREGAIDRLVELYKMSVYKSGGYLTDSGEVNLDRVQLILNELGKAEDKIFKDRQQREQQFKMREKAKRRREQNSSFNSASPVHRPTFQENMLKTYNDTERRNPYGQNFYTDVSQQSSNDSSQVRRNFPGQKRSAAEAELDEDEKDYQDNDEVRLWEDGFKDRYYESKFDVSPENLEFRYSVALQYVRGLCWVLKYYYQGCASWNWYFPYHYAPFASDFINISGLSTSFEKNTKPFNPLEQLMAVFPAASSSHVPKPWAELMHDPKSPIIDFYPEDFKIDLNGKKFAWQGVALLPFVDEERLFKALKPFYDKLDYDEIQRNQTGDCRLYVTKGNSEFKFLKAHYNKQGPYDAEEQVIMQSMRGSILSAKENVALCGFLQSPIGGLENITNNQVITTRFRDPVYKDDYVFLAIRLPNAIEPAKVLAPETRSHNYKPVIGFNPHIPTASLDISGHRMLNRYSSHAANSPYRRNANSGYESNHPPPRHYNNPMPTSSGTQGNWINGNWINGNNMNYNTYNNNRERRDSYNNNFNFMNNFNKYDNNYGRNNYRYNDHRRH